MVISKISWSYCCILMFLTTTDVDTPFNLLTPPGVWSSCHYSSLSFWPVFPINRIAFSACLQASQIAEELNWPQALHKHLWNLAVWRQLWTTAPEHVHLELYTSRLLERPPISLHSVHVQKGFISSKNIKELFLWSGAVCVFILFYLPKPLI